MKRNATFLCGLAMSALLQLTAVFNSNAQNDGTQNDDFLFQLELPNGAKPTYSQSNTAGGWGYAAFGPDVTAPISGELVWYKPDTLGCGASTQDLNGKIALIRRGTCGFHQKTLNAQGRGAIAVVVVNGNEATHMDDLFSPNMALDATLPNTTIPAISICRSIGSLAIPEIDKGNTVIANFIFPRMVSAFAGYDYAIPVSQVALLDNVGFSFTNREATAIDSMIAYAEIHEPGGNVTILESALPSIPVGTADTLILFEYTPPAVEGEFEAVFYTNKYTEPRDTLRRKFVHTKYTYATDNLQLQLDGGADRNDLFVTGDLLYQVASMIVTGDNGGVATHATFGVANIDSVYVPGNDLANTLTIYLYDGDADSDGRLDLDGDFSVLEIAGIGNYILTGTEKEEVLLDVTLYNLLGDAGVTLLANHYYYISVQYNGSEAGTGRNCAFTNTANVPYLSYLTEGGAFRQTAPIFLANQLNTWGDRTVVCRLQMEGYTPASVGVKPSLLDDSKYTVAPNPASDHMRLDLDLATQGTVDISIINPMGQRLYSQVLKNFQNGQLNLDVQKIPSGTYMLVVRTAEGLGLRKVSICH
ncbi:MAG: T9SS type A sorting domain-containing protein [Saprospiraceae bacterium]|nr:T9SS type A sorting domain-containing protein [Saprospiraceae bacterium]